MASKVDRQKLKDLVCPLCLDVFKNPTLLSCGHTFCRECLEAYDEQHHHDHIVCPVCRESTNLGQKRVAGLKPNFIARDMQDKLHVVPPSQSFCPLHTNVHNDIFCEDCTQWICLTCFVESHKDHKIKKKEELEGDLRKKRDSLISRSEMRKAQIEKCVDNAEQHRIDTHSHYSRVEKEIKDEFAKKVTILKQKEESLLKKIDSIRKETENQFVACIANIRQAIDDTKKSIEMLRGYTGENVNSDLMKTQYLQFSELEQSLETRIPVDEASTVRLKETAESTRFCPSDEKLLALGHIEVGLKERKTATGVKRKSEQPPAARKKVAVIPSPVRSKALKIVRQVDTPADIERMAAQSQDAVVVGYGELRTGSYRILVSGKKTQHLKSEVGDVYDIAFLTDGRLVVSHGYHTLRVYSTDRHSTGMQYTCKGGPFIIRLCVDQYDNIHAVNGNQEIYIFHGSNPNPQRVIPTGDIEPRQICVTKTGALITRSKVNWLYTLRVFDREGHVGSSITASDDDEYLYATVDSLDRVLVARARRRSDVFRLTRYTLQGTTLIQQVAFNELKLPSVIMMFPFYGCMTSLAPQLIAFAHGKHVDFIELAE